MAKVPKVIKDWHEMLGLERETICIQLCDLLTIWFMKKLVCEEVDDNIEQTRDKIMSPHDMTCDGWNGRKLEGKIFDGHFCFPVDKEIGIHDMWIHGAKMAP